MRSSIIVIIISICVPSAAFAQFQTKEKQERDEYGFVISKPTDSHIRYEALMKLWGDMTFDRRDNFMSQIEGVTHKDSDEGAEISTKEYESLLKLSKQEDIPRFKIVDKNGRPENRSERRNIVQETCEKFKAQLYKRCEKKWFEIVAYTSEESDEISNLEWDEFQALVKKIRSKGKP